MKISLTGEISCGKIYYSDNEKYLDFVQKNQGKKITVTLDTNRQRTLNQNNYYWGVVIKILGDELGYDYEDVHELLKWKLLPRRFIGKDQIEVAKSTANLPTKEMEEYLEKCRRFSAQYGITIPDPE